MPAKKCRMHINSRVVFDAENKDLITTGKRFLLKLRDRVAGLGETALRQINSRNFLRHASQVHCNRYRAIRASAFSDRQRGVTGSPS